jgi:deoxyribose-phosphate aldolase
MTLDELAKSIDFALLRPDATINDVRRFCEKALEHNFATVFVNPCYIPIIGNLLRESAVKAGVAIGFPLGASTTSVKRFEAEDAIERGAREVDMVMNVGALKSGQPEMVARELASIVELTRKKEVEESTGTILVKVIIETCYLTDAEKRTACRLVEESGADFVKTSTGFGPSGATPYDVRLLRKSVSSNVGVKASGGIRNLEQVISMLDAGASRIGTSSGVEIVTEFLAASKQKVKS